MTDTTAVFWGIDKPTWAVIGAIAAVAIPMIYNMVNEIIKASRERKYVMVQLIFLLDKFTSGCEAVAWDDGFPPGHPGNGAAHKQHKSPKLGLITVKGELKFLKAARLHELQSIDIRQRQIQQELREVDWQYDHPDLSNYFGQRRRHYAELGIFTAELTRKICRELVITQDEWKGKETPEASCQRSLIKLNRRRADMTMSRKYNKAKSVMKRQETAKNAKSSSANDE
ncbi:hypothetical protein BS639_17420 [Rouxiella silvae]|uniref:Uncharacterized protein n=1 Tax=Rouxiella silvae TaxID=1646373 RepID=A0ABX3TXY2_9GAMM|nr:hypothetical protein [Rouxiella silvae]ORJ19954.1 hypothetical protein BS639_17420 [Rouxiella silvae]